MSAQIPIVVGALFFSVVGSACSSTASLQLDGGRSGVDTDAGVDRNEGSLSTAPDASSDRFGPGDAAASGTREAAGGNDGGQGGRGIQVLFPPSSGSSTFNAVETYLMKSSADAYPYVAGAVIEINWSDFDLGDASAGTHASYDFSISDGAIAPWIAASKTVNLVLQNTTYGGSACPGAGPGSHGTSGIGNCAMPPWMLAALTSANTTTCGASGNTQQVPNFRASTFETNYKAAIVALLDHYGPNPGIGYIRVGLGKGGEINLPSGWDDTTTPCGMYTSAWSYTVGSSASDTWNAYLQGMLEYEGSLHSPKQLMVSITPVTTHGVTGSVVPDFLAPIAVSNGIGFGSQGLQYSDTTNYPICGGDWCNLFQADTGKVPLELQTFGASCPEGVGQCPSDTLSNATGSLVPLLPFAVLHHATTIEIYYQDWLIAFDPNNSESQYGAAYRQALQAAAGAL